MDAYEFLVQKALSKNDYVALVKTLLDIRQKRDKGILSRVVDQQEAEEALQADSRTPWEKAYDEGVDYMQDNIFIILDILKSNSIAPESTKWLIKAFSLLESVGREEILLLLEKMIRSDERSIRNAAFEVLTEKRETPDSPDFWTLCESPHVGDEVERVLGSVFGIRLLEYLPRVITAARNEGLTEKVICAALEPRSSIFKKNCDLVQRETGKFFMAFEFENRAVKDVVADYFQTHSPAYEIQIAGESLGALTISGEIVSKLLASAFAVFDLSPSKKKPLNRFCGFPNHNVVLELGLALAFGIPCILLVRQGTLQISDLQGWQHIEYRRLSDIAANIKRKLPPKSWEKFLKNYG